MKTIILDPGHGGSWMGRYATAGKRSPKIPPGFFEGIQMRKIVSELMSHAIDRYDWVCPILEMPASAQPDVALKSRIRCYNAIDCDLVLSVHSNAKGHGERWYNADGAIVFYDHKSKKRNALNFVTAYSNDADMRNRGAKFSAGLAMMRTSHREMLIETGFHTHRGDVERLKDVEKIAGAIVSGLDAYFQ